MWFDDLILNKHTMFVSVLSRFLPHNDPSRSSIRHSIYIFPNPLKRLEVLSHASRFSSRQACRDCRYCSSFFIHYICGRTNILIREGTPKAQKERNQQHSAPRYELLQHQVVSPEEGVIRLIFAHKSSFPVGFIVWSHLNITWSLINHKDSKIKYQG